jgi:hypothetical protein
MKSLSNQVSILQVENQTCPATAYQSATVCVPVRVRPYAIAGIPTTICCGEPIVTNEGATCAGTLNGRCSFTLTQDICIEVPVEFGARSRVGRPFVECGEVSNEDICTDCDEIPVPEIN